jgi:hypothetical protein
MTSRSTQRGGRLSQFLSRTRVAGRRRSSSRTRLPKPGNTATALAALTATGGTPVDTSAGKVRKVPPRDGVEHTSTERAPWTAIGNSAPMSPFPDLAASADQPAGRARRSIPPFIELRPGPPVPVFEPLRGRVFPHCTLLARCLAAYGAFLPAPVAPSRVRIQHKERGRCNVHGRIDLQPDWPRARDRAPRR